MQNDPRHELPRGEIEDAYRFLCESMKPIRGIYAKFSTRQAEKHQKLDKSLVTEVDTEIEQTLLRLITSRYPGHGIFGEEGTRMNRESEYQWIIDPLDGTQSLVHGIPTFGTMAALWYKGAPVTGVIDHPVLDLSYHGAFGCGSYCNEERLQIIDAPGAEIDFNEVLSLCMRAQFELSRHGAAYDALQKFHRHIRAYYDCFGLSRAVSGQVGAHIELNTPPWDLGPCRILTEEAGGAYAAIKTGARSGALELASGVFGKPSVVRIILAFLADHGVPVV